MAYDAEEKLTKLTWDEYGKRVDDLFEKVRNYLDENEVKLNAIVPIMREGGFVGLPFAFKFNTWKILPIQFKYFLKPGISPYDQVPTLMAEFPEIHYELPEESVFLVTDVFPGGGKTASAVGEKIKEKFPKSKAIYACMFQDVSFEKPNTYIASIAGCFTDDTDQLSAEEKEKKGIETEYYLMPWHNAAEEMAPVTGKTYDYDF